MDMCRNDFQRAANIYKTVTLLSGLLVSLFVGFCGAQTNSESPAIVFSVRGHEARHFTRIYPMRGNDRSRKPRPYGLASTPAATATGPDLLYYGGQVISSVQVIVVYWGTDVSPAATSGIPDFYSAITSSTWADELSEYSTQGITPVEGGAAGTQPIGRGSLVGAYTITPSADNSGNIVDDTQIQAELVAQINAGNLPAPATDSSGQIVTLYMIYFPPGLSITLQGSASCVQFCAYHGTTSFNNLDLPYGVLPDLGPGSACSSGCAAGTELEDLTTVSSHEFAESITDPGVGLATSNAPPLGWYDNTYGEIGDICNASGDPTNQAVLPGTGYTVQKIWSNLQGDCVSAPPTFTVSTPASISANTPFSLTVSVQSSTGIVLNPPYTGTVEFSSTDPAAVLPSNYTFTEADANSHTFTNAATLKAPGSQAITVTDTQSGGFHGSAQISVIAHTSPYFSLTVPYAATTGTPFTFTVTAFTASGNVNSAYSGMVHFTSSDSQAILPADTPLVNGTAIFTATLRTSGSQTITATDTVTTSITGSSLEIAASGPATHFAIIAPPSANTGVAFAFTVTALDQSNSLAATYSGTIHFTSTDAAALLPANATLTNGTGRFIATLNSAGTQTITAEDTSAGTITGGSSAITVSAAATHFSVSAPASATASTAFNFTVTALDQFNNVAPGYSGTVRFSSSDFLAVLPSNSTLTNGTGSFSATLKTAGAQTITATDSAISTVTGVSGTISVVVAPPAFSPNPGTYTTPQIVSLSDSSPGVTIYYTVDGTTPTTSSSQYAGPIAISSTTTVQAIAAGNGYATSLYAFGIYKIVAATPTFSPIAGTYNSPQTVAIADATPGVTIYYTTDSSTPTTASPQYTGPITIATTTTLQAIAAGAGYGASATAYGTYRINAVAPTFSPYPGTYGGPQTVTIADVSPGVTIYYTTDGSMPTTSSPRYTGPITISATTTLQAIAAGNGYGASSSAYGIYRIGAAVPTFSPAPGSYSGPQMVSIADASPGVTIYYTTNGTTPSTASTPYTSPITISTTTTLQAIAAGNGYASSSVASGTYSLATAAKPIFSPAPGSYSGPQTVSISDSSSGVTIFYTTDGSTPTSSSNPYSGPVTISTTTTLQAIAAGNGYPASPVGGGLYKIATAVPTFSPYPGTYTSAQSVNISDATPGAAIYYTTDGSTPTTSSLRYSGPILISSTTTLQATAVASGFAASSNAFGIYRINATTPTFSPYPGTYNTPQTVTISDASPGVTIYYTTDGSTPTTMSQHYTGPITISATTTLQAIASGNGYGTSSSAYGIYRINALPPVFSPSPGAYTGHVTVTIADSTPGVTIYYTTDGSTPTTSSPKYTGPITISMKTTLQAIAAGNGYGPSSETYGIYTIN